MLEEELKQKGLEVMEEELLNAKNDMGYAEHEVESMVSNVIFWKNELIKAREKLIVAAKKYEEKVGILEEVRELIKC